MNRRKFIIVGEAWLRIQFRDGKAAGSCPGGDFVDVARSLASAGESAMLICELGDDAPGRLIASELEAQGVDLSFADRYAPATSITLEFPAIERYGSAGAGHEGLDIAWPRVEKEDVVVFGGYMALEERVRERLTAFLANCKERNATLVYVPAVADERITRITREMPRVFENLELADMVVTLPGDLTTLYGYEDPERAYKNNLSFYCSRVASILAADDEKFTLRQPDGATATASSHIEILSEILKQQPVNK